jgi:cyclopropane fatty-acyl-phospholipid synthase-like methyltransferase
MFQYNHNKHYTDLLLRQVPPGCQNALDVGCGDGSLARRLADRFGIAVTGIDRDQASTSGHKQPVAPVRRGRLHTVSLR